MIPEFGKYAPYVWSAYGISALVLGFLIVRTFMGTPRD